MVTGHEHHEELIGDLAREYDEILNSSAQGIYAYLDDVHKLCNERFASMLGYGSAAEWAGVRRPFTEAFVAPGSQETLVSAYLDAIEQQLGSRIPVTWRSKSGPSVATDVILVPIAFRGELLALHFIDEREP